MYRAKALGKDRHDLRRAIDRGEFLLHYQPILCLSTQRVVGFEALLRWQRTHGPLVLPNDFISIAEETGLIVPLGTWAVEEACRQLSAWQMEFPSAAPLTMAVNISARQLEEPSFVPMIAAIIQRTGVAKGTLHLELTESALVGSSDAMLAKLGKLRDLAIRLHLDDFGTGYSSLSYLHRFPLDVIKIDRSFLHKFRGKDADDHILVEAIVTLAKKLGLGVVAEGVETSAQLAHLQRADCRHAQGYLFSQPQDATTTHAALRRSAGASGFPVVPQDPGVANSVVARV